MSTESETSTLIVIERGFQEGKQLTQTQKSSALFSEEPVVMGRTLRRGSPSMKISIADYKANELRLLQLEKAGAVKITRPETNMKPCELCGQTPRGQSGDFKCPKCDLPTVMDLGAPPEQKPADPVPPPPPSAPTPPPADPVVTETPVPAETKPEEPAVEKKEESAPVSEKSKSSKKK